MDAHNRTKKGDCISTGGAHEGLSLWFLHAVPNNLLEICKSCALSASCSELPPQLQLVYDRKYEAVLENGETLTFDHCLITPKGKYTREEIETALGPTNWDRCAGHGNAKPLTDYSDWDLNLVEQGYEESRAAQHVLLETISGQHTNAADKLDAAILYAFLGSLPCAFADLPQLYPWAASFLQRVLSDYHLKETDNPYIREHHGNALHALNAHIKPL
jgi:hypothetical protein